MEIRETYPTLDDAKVGIQAHEKQGHRVLHENHIYGETIVKEMVGSVEEERKVTVLDHAEIVFDTAPDNISLPIIDWKARYAAAATTSEKLGILAERLGLQ